MNILRRLIGRARFNRKYGMHPGVLQASPLGLSLGRHAYRNGSIEVELVWEIEWIGVQRIVAFKRDLFSVDRICVAFELNNKVVEMNEEMEGYDGVIAELPKHFTGMETQWWDKVARPAFDTNLTTLWQRN